MVIAWLNTAPETIFFITALESNNQQFAIGAMSGSVIVVCTIAVGVCVIIGAANRKSNTITLFAGVRKQTTLLGVSLINPMLTVIFGFQYHLSFISAFSYILFVIYTLLSRNGDDVNPPTKNTSFPLQLINLEEGGGRQRPSINIINGTDRRDLEEDGDEQEHPTWKGFLYLAIGGFLIYFCSAPFIELVVQVGHALHIHTIVLAFFLAPIASEAPEILESISLSRKGKAQNINIAFSNLVGGTISKTTLFVGVCLRTFVCFFYSIMLIYIYMSM